MLQICRPIRACRMSNLLQDDAASFRDFTDKLRMPLAAAGRQTDWLQEQASMISLGAARQKMRIIARSLDCCRMAWHCSEELTAVLHARHAAGTALQHPRQRGIYRRNIHDRVSSMSGAHVALQCRTAIL